MSYSEQHNIIIVQIIYIETNKDIDELEKRVDNNNIIVILQMRIESKSRPIETQLFYNDRKALSSGSLEVYSS